MPLKWQKKFIISAAWTHLLGWFSGYGTCSVSPNISFGSVKEGRELTVAILDGIPYDSCTRTKTDHLGRYKEMVICFNLKQGINELIFYDITAFWNLM